MKTAWPVLIMGTLFSLTTFGSTKVCIDNKKKELQVSAHIYFYGDEAKHEVARPCIDEINRLFNNGTQIMLNKSGDYLKEDDEWLKIVFDVKYSIVSEV